MPYYISGPPLNPLTRLLAAVVGALALVGALFFGFFIFLGALALGLVAWLAFRLRVWWLRRKYGDSVPPFGAPGWPPGSGDVQERGDVIDGEYEVVSGEDEKDAPPGR
jgi:hypothetical protein